MIAVLTSRHIRTMRTARGFRSCNSSTGVPQHPLDAGRVRMELSRRQFRIGEFHHRQRKGNANQPG